MATKITVALEDDLDGGPADETRRFAIRGTAYEIDLNKKNARAFASSWRPSSSTPARPAGSRRAGSCPAGLRCNTGRVPSLSATTRRFSLAMGTLRRSAMEASPEADDQTDASLAGTPTAIRGGQWDPWRSSAQAARIGGSGAQRSSAGVLDVHRTCMMSGQSDRSDSPGHKHKRRSGGAAGWAALVGCDGWISASRRGGER